MRIPLRALNGLLLVAASVVSTGRCQAAETTDAARLESAVQYVERFLKEDASPASGGGHRDASAPPARDYPVHDCALTTIVRGIRQMGAPTFEDGSHRIVKIPVVAEIVLFYNAGTGGGAAESEGGEEGNWCTFEYDRYDFHTGVVSPNPIFF
jgi:hypothetical protein